MGSAAPSSIGSLKGSEGAVRHPTSNPSTPSPQHHLDSVPIFIDSCILREYEPEDGEVLRQAVSSVQRTLEDRYKSTARIASEGCHVLGDQDRKGSQYNS
jgi:hypothetical protein